ncbi:MAG: ABC transporter ATP-binding protein [Roseivivax sp.]|nr:ABC transporter ATP-binding protein [Roseivivax sp.]
MLLTDYLDDFAVAVFLPGPEPKAPPATEDMTGDSLAAFEEGYKAGWDDAVKAQNNDSRQIAGDLGQNLLDLSFTYHEAVAQVVRSLSPVLRQMVDAVLPALARQSLAPQIVEQLDTAVQHGADVPVEVLVAEGDLAAVTEAMDRDFGFPVRLRAAPELKQGQAEIRFADRETQIDMEEVLAAVGELMQGFLYENDKAVKHG